MAKRNKKVANSLENKLSNENMFNQFELSVIGKYFLLKEDIPKIKISVTNDSLTNLEGNKLKVIRHLTNFESAPDEIEVLESIKVSQMAVPTVSNANMLRLGDTGKRKNSLKPFGLSQIITIYVGDSLVKHAYSERFKCQVAIKTVPRFYLHSEKQGKRYKMLQNDLKIITTLNHNNIMKLYNYIVTDFEIHVIMEYCKNGTLADLMADITFIPECVAQGMFKGLSEGLQYCHHRRIFHRNITCDNIFISEHMHLKLANFRLTKRGTDDIKEPIGTYMYTAPEVRNREYSSGILGDMWSMGTVLYVMLVGKLPYSIKDYKQLGEDETCYKVKPSQEIIITSMVQSLIGSLLCQTSSRFVCEQVLAHQWLATILPSNGRFGLVQKLKDADSNKKLDTDHKKIGRFGQVQKLKDADSNKKLDTDHKKIGRFGQGKKLKDADCNTKSDTGHKNTLDRIKSNSEKSVSIKSPNLKATRVKKAKLNRTCTLL